MDRALREFRIRGVSTNIAFVENLLKHPTFLNNQYTTKFIDETPELFEFAARKDRAARLRHAGETALGAYLRSRVGAEIEVLAEADGRGRCRHYAPVRLDFDPPPGAVEKIRVAAVADGHLVGTRAA